MQRLVTALLAAGFLLSLIAPVLIVPARADEPFIYVKKETREATRQATLEANGAAGFSGSPWYLIGPFANQGLAKPWPPEKEIDLAAHYPGKAGEVAWRKTEFPDAHVNDLRSHFKQSDQCVCYLYRRIESPAARRVTISLGSDDGIEVWFNGKQVLFRDAIRSCEADQDLVDVDLHAGRNDLLLKISNIAGDWAFYFAPTVARTALLRLERGSTPISRPPPARPRSTGSRRFPCRRTKRSKWAAWRFGPTARCMSPRAAAMSGSSRIRLLKIRRRSLGIPTFAGCMKCWG